MKRNGLKMMLISVLMMTLFLAVPPSPASAQTPQPADVKILKTLDDDSVALSINGRKYLAITREQLDAWQKLQIDYDSCALQRKEDATQIETLQRKWELAVKDTATAAEKADLYKADFDRAREDAKRNFNLFTTERELRVEAQQFIPHGSGGNGFVSKLLDFIDRPEVQAGFKLGIPIYQTWKCS